MPIALAALLVLPALSAQQSAYTGQSWIGLLVSGSCDASGRAGRSASQNESDLTTSGRVTTPAVDSSGTRGQSTAAEPASTPPRHNDSPRTGDIHDKAATTDPGWKAAQKQASALPETCAVDASTSAFSLLLADGRFLRFDDLASQGILKQLKARGGNRKTIFRVHAAGKLERGRIALDTIQL